MFGGPELVSTGLNTQWENYALLVAEGAGSVLNLGSLQSINAGFNDGHSGRFTRQRIAATLGGTVDLSALQNVIGPHQADDRLDFIFANDGTLSVPELKTVSSANSGYTRFYVNATIATLPALQNVSRTHFELSENATLDLPELITHNRGTLTIREGASLSAGNLQSLTNATISISPTGSFSAPSITDLSGSTLVLESPDQTINIGSISLMDNARINVAGGIVFDAITATTYDTSSLNDQWADYLILSASGAGTLLDASTIESISAGFNDGHNTRFTRQRIEAVLGGTVDLSNLQSITGPVQSDDRLDFIMTTGATFGLSSLQAINSAGSGYTRFAVTTADLTLASLATMSYVQFDVQEGATVNLPVAVTHNHASYTISEEASVSAPELVELSNATITIAPTGDFFAPALTDIHGSVLALDSSEQGLTTGNLANLTNARINIADGIVFDAVSAADYTTTGLNVNWEDYLILAAEGPGTLLDLSSIENINAGFNDAQGSRFTRQRIEATEGGMIDLSSVHTITAPYRGDDQIEITANTGGMIDLSSLQLVQSANSGWTVFTVGGAAMMQFGDLTANDHMQIILEDPTSILDVGGSLMMESCLLEATGGATLAVGGHVTFDQTEETDLDLQSGILWMDGSGIQYLEVGGEDLWTFTDRNTPNFGYGQLIVGQEEQSTIVELVDVVDNGNRTEGGTEALYLYGLGGPQGLRILGGSTLVIANINVYAKVQGEWLHINTLFPPGVDAIEYDHGYIMLHQEGVLCNCDADVDLDLGDYVNLADCMTGPINGHMTDMCECSDPNRDGRVDLRDFATVQRAYTGWR